MDGQRQQWQTDQATAEQQLRQRTQELDARHADLEAQHEAMAEERRRWEEERAEAEQGRNQPQESPDAAPQVPEEPEFKTPAAEAPVNLADIFRRLGTEVSLPEDEAEQAEPAKDSASSVAPERTSPPAKPNQKD